MNNRGEGRFRDQAPREIPRQVQSPIREDQGSAGNSLRPGRISQGNSERMPQGDQGGNGRNPQVPRGYQGRDSRVGSGPGRDFQAPRGYQGARNEPRDSADRREQPRPSRGFDAGPQEPENPAELVCGQHAVEALLQTQPQRIQRLLLERGAGEPRLYTLQKMAEEAGIPCQQLMARELGIRSGGRRHQGVVAVCNVREFVEWEQLRETLMEKMEAGENPMVLMAAAIEDPRNLGAIARTAVGMGVCAMILPRKGGCGLTPIVEETSAGALAHLPVARPGDLESVLQDLVKCGFKVMGLDATGEDIRTIDFSGPIVLVAGGEDRGIPPHLRRPCQRLIRLPMDSRLQSYNASVAAAMALYEIGRNRQ